MAKPFHTYDVDAAGNVSDPSNPGGLLDVGDDIQGQYNGLDIGQSNTHSGHGLFEPDGAKGKLGKGPGKGGF
jgi:hypothetical protein